MLRLFNRRRPIARPIARTISSFYRLFPQTIPDGPPPKGKFDIDVKKLREEYIQAQRGAHPDVATGNTVSSADLSNAYRALTDPLTRAEHILELNGENPLEEGSSLTDEDLLMPIIMAREKVSEAESPEELRSVAEENTERTENALQELGSALNSGDFKTAKAVLVKLTYWKKLAGAIEQREEDLKRSCSAAE